LIPFGADGDEIRAFNQLNGLALFTAEFDFIHGWAIWLEILWFENGWKV
jgi:hypothetical protein